MLDTFKFQENGNGVPEYLIEQLQYVTILNEFILQRSDTNTTQRSVFYKGPMKIKLN